LIDYYYYDYRAYENNEIPCKNYMDTINNAYNFLDVLQNQNHRNEDNNFILNDSKTEMKISYTSRMDLEKIEHNPKLLEQLIRINITEQNFYDLKIFEGKHFSALKELKLEENNIFTIDSLMKAGTFDLLDEFSLARNKIDDNELLKHLDKFGSKFPKLTFFNIYGNYLTDYNIFKKLTGLQELKKLYIGANKFEKNEIEEDIFFPKLEEFGASDGVFNNNTIKCLSHFKFENLIEIYLQGNGLNSLNFLKYLNCKDLKVLWLYNNYIQDYKSMLNYDFKKMEDINLKYNIINNIDDIIGFIKEYKFLKYLYLSKNPINLNYSEKKIKNKEIEKVNNNLILDL
jgi:hypothetical protein